MTEPTLYHIVDEFPYLEREDVYGGLTLTEAAIRMDDLTGCGEDVILADWDEPCELCAGRGYTLSEDSPKKPICALCRGTGKWPGPWEWTDDETTRTVTMMREVA